MTGFRRRRPESDEVQAQEEQPEQEVQTEAPVIKQPEMRVPGHIERSLIMLTTKLQQCVERLDALEARVEEMNDHAMTAPSHSDVMEVRMHSAKLAAELARTTVELRGEIGLASNEARRAARAAQSAADEAALATEAAAVDPGLHENDAFENEGYEEKPHPFSQTA